MPYAQINPTGCGIHKNRAKLRLDFFLNPGEPNYKRYGDTPFHSHFIYPNPDISDSDLKVEIERCLNYFYAFHQHCWDKKVNFIEEWRKVPRVKGSVRDVFIKGDLKGLSINRGKVKNILLRAHEFQVGVSKVPPQDLKIGEKGTIDVGSTAEDRGASWILSSPTAIRTLIDYNNPANATGTIDTVEAYFYGAESGNVFRAGSFQDNGSGSFTCNDGEEIGEVSGTGYKQFTGLSIDVSTGDYIGCDGKQLGYYLSIDRDPSGGSGVYYINGALCDPEDEGSFTLLSGDILSLYGTGTEGGEHYERSGTALLGLLGAGSRGLGLARSNTSLLGLKGIGSRAVAYAAKAGTALLGLLSTAERALALGRSNTALLGLKGIGSRALDVARSGIALLGLKATGIMATAGHYIREGVAYLGLVATGTRTIALTKLDTALLGLKGIASRNIALIQSTTALLGLKAIGIRGIALSRTDIALLGLKGIGSRVLSLIKADTALLGLKGIASRTRGYIRTKTALLGLKGTATRTISLTRSKDALLGLLGTGLRTIALARSKTALLGLKAIGVMETADHYVRTGIAYLGLTATATRTIVLSRADTALLGLKGIASRAVAFTRSKTALLGLLVMGTKTHDYIRVQTALLGLAATGTRTINLIRSYVALLGLVATGSRAIALSRAGIVLLGLKGAASRIFAFTRAGVALLGLKVTASKSFLEELKEISLDVLLRSRAIITSLYNRVSSVLFPNRDMNATMRTK